MKISGISLAFIAAVAAPSVGASPSSSSLRGGNDRQEERMLQLDKPAKKELEAQLDGAIMQLQDELGLTKKEAKELEKKLNKDLKAAIKSLSGGAAGSIEVSVVGNSIEIKILPGTTTTTSTTTAGTTTSSTTTTTTGATTTAAGCAGGWKLNEAYCLTPNQGIYVCYTFTKCPTLATSGGTIGESVQYGCDDDDTSESVVLNSITSDMEIIVITGGTTLFTWKLSEDGTYFTNNFGYTYSITP
jgi:hypothetical protein